MARRKPDSLGRDQEPAAWRSRSRCLVNAGVTVTKTLAFTPEGVTRWGAGGAAPFARQSDHANDHTKLLACLAVVTCLAIEMARLHYCEGPAYEIREAVVRGRSRAIS
jgi:hypothetical protein